MKKALLIIGVLVVAGVGYYAISPLFNTVELDDAVPTTGTSTTETADTEGNVMEQDTETPSADTGPEVRGPFAVVDTQLHPASGSVFVYENADGTSTVRFEGFETINGPNIRIYLANDLDADEYVDIGPLKGTSGNINYEVPAGIDVSDYRYVLHWCEPFSVLFNYAEIQ